MTQPESGPFWSLGIPYQAQMKLARARFHSLPEIFDATNKDLEELGLSKDDVKAIRKAAKAYEGKSSSGGND